METEDAMEKATVLVVDDDRNMRELLGHFLRRGNYHVLSAKNGREGLEMARSEAPDLLLLDVHLEGMDGFEVARQMQEDDQLRRMPVIFLTADKDMNTRLQSYDLGAADFVSKPFEWQDLLGRIGNRLRQKQGADRERTQAKVETLSQLMVTLAHYLNNALAVMVMQNQLTKPGDTAKVKEFKHEVDRGVQKVRAVVQSLEEMARQGRVASEEYAGMKDAMLDIHDQLKSRLEALQKPREDESA